MPRRPFVFPLLAFLFVPALTFALDQALFDTLAAFHGHTCAGSLMGARLGAAARAALTASSPTGKLKARVFLHACPVDGIQIFAGTTYGNRALEVEDKDQMRLGIAVSGVWYHGRHGHESERDPPARPGRQRPG